MRNLILALFIGLAALTAAACGNSGTTTSAPGDSLAPIVSPSTDTDGESPSESVEPSPAAS